MVHTLVNIMQSFESQSLCNIHFYGLRGCQTQGPPRAANILAAPLCWVSILFKSSTAINYQTSYHESFSQCGKPCGFLGHGSVVFSSKGGSGLFFKTDLFITDHS